ncbi:hypothetical protein [Saccharopolyspora pogona]|uniref:hypothetical protein n=1 Tax=Saccharopolyspora pogona TaxID=333966 RepID=UPI0016860EE3|nr:hypothetical protein [Saccharopolyspora pogona]
MSVVVDGTGIGQRPYPVWVCDLNAARARKAFVVKKIPHEQSRRNATRRRRRVAARHARAGHWGARSAPMLTSGKVSYEVGGNIDATCFGGIAALHRLVVKLGLVDRINDDLELLKVHLPYHESDHVLNLA